MIREKKNLYCLISVVFISYFGLALPFPIMAPLFLGETTEALEFAATFPVSPRLMLGIALAVYPLGQFFGSPFFGSLSDRFGRKPILMISMIAGGVGYIFSALAIIQNNIWMLLISRFVTGIFESNFPIARAAAADLSPAVSKSYSFGLLNAAITGGFIVGPVLGGILSDADTHPWFSTDLPFWVASVINFVALGVLVLFFDDMQKTKAETSDKGMQDIGKPFRIASMIPLMLMSFLITLSFDTFYQFYPMFLVEKWNFDSLLIAAMTMPLTAGMVVTQTLLISASKRWMSTAQNIIVFGFAYAALLLIILLPEQAWPLYGLMLIVGGTIGLVGTHLPVYVSDEVPDWAQGKVMGQTMSLRFLGDAGICFAGGWIAVFSINYPLILGAIFCFLGVIWFWWFYAQKQRLAQLNNANQTS